MLQVRLFLIAVQFYTRVPIPAWVGFEPEWLTRSTRYFPLVGGLVGAAIMVVMLLASGVLGDRIGVLIAIAFGVLLTGAFHEDGFTDTCDGLGGGQTPAQALAIMKDSRIGAYGTIGIVLLLLVKWEALLRIDPLAIVAAHGFSRGCAVLMMHTLPYLRADAESKAKPIAVGLRTGDAAIAYGFALLAVVPMLVAPTERTDLQAVAIALAAALLVTLWFRRRLARKLGGYTGDTLGATQQLAEVAFYLGLAATT